MYLSFIIKVWKFRINIMCDCGRDVIKNKHFKVFKVMEEKKIYYKVIEIMPVESGTSQTTGREWKSREFVAEEIE